MNLIFANAARLLSDEIEYPAGYEWLKQIVNTVNSLLWPMLILVGAAGLIYSIVLGVNISRADSTEKREEAKKRLINVIIGLAVIIALIFFFKLFISTILPGFFKK